MGKTRAQPELTPWLKAVRRAVRAIPRGETASYARVALMAGKPGAARAVVRALHALDDVPWWRVLRSDGTVAPQIADEQRARLTAEGVVFSGRRVVSRKSPR
ncbi:MAG: MGMT family protein [Myxococcota bacterium]